MVFIGFRFPFGFAVLQAEYVGCVLSLLPKTQDPMSDHYNLTAAQTERIRETAARFNEPWTREEKNAVSELFRDGKRIEEIALVQGRTRNAIKIKLTEAGELAPYMSRRNQPWTEEETERLGRFHSQGYPIASCSKMLGRIRSEAEERLIEIGLLTVSDQQTVRQSSAFPKAYEPWSEDEINQLKSELEAHRQTLAALTDIAARHGRSLGSILARATKDGLCTQETPECPDPGQTNPVRSCGTVWQDGNGQPTQAMSCPSLVLPRRRCEGRYVVVAERKGPVSGKKQPRRHAGMLQVVVAAKERGSG